MAKAVHRPWTLDFGLIADDQYVPGNRSSWLRKCQGQRMWLLALPLWLGLIVGGQILLLRYNFAAGKTTPGPKGIPTLKRARLFVALHPRCPCSRATVRELAKILTRAADSSDVTALMFKPASEPDSWTEGGLAEDCRRMKCQVRPDPDGTLAAALGSLTSGAVALYDANGKLRYQGGITAARGHEGDNLGEKAVIEILQGSKKSYQGMPVFGCPIQQEAKR